MHRSPEACLAGLLQASFDMAGCYVLVTSDIDWRSHPNRHVACECAQQYRAQQPAVLIASQCVEHLRGGKQCGKLSDKRLCDLLSRYRTDTPWHHLLLGCSVLYMPHVAQAAHACVFEDHHCIS